MSLPTPERLPAALHDVAAGPLAINNAADLYLYPNTVYAVKVAGSDIKNWLETAAKRFNTIDPTQATVQKLVSTFPGYNFDMFTIIHGRRTRYFNNFVNLCHYWLSS